MNTSNDFRKTLSIVRDQIFDSIRSIMEKLGGRVCFRMYHEGDIAMRYTFFEVDGDGYGRELFLDTATTNKTNNEINILLHDTEDCYEPVWALEDLNPVDALYMLEELEQIAEFHEKNPDKKVLTEYDMDFDWDNY
jgi:hypothetical protein